MRHGKTSGKDGIPAQTNKAGGKIMIRRLTEVFNLTYEQKETPDEWQYEVTCRIHKKKRQ